MSAKEGCGTEGERLAMWAVSLCVRTIKCLVLTVVVILLAANILARFDGARHYPLTKVVYGARAVVMATIGQQVRNNMPTRIRGRDRTDWILGILVLFAGGLAGRLERKVRERIARREVSKKVASFIAASAGMGRSAHIRKPETTAIIPTADKADDSGKVTTTVTAPSGDTGSTTRHLAVLSVDVVGAAAMIHNEEPAIAKADFSQYRRMAERIFGDNDVIEMAWTPDGFLACFSNIAAAVKAGQSVIMSLSRFNHETKQMNTDFAVRCGVSSGYINLDGATPLDQVSDQVIELANQMQKQADPNTVAIAKAAIKRISDSESFRATDKTVSGLQICLWSPKVMAPA